MAELIYALLFLITMLWNNKCADAADLLVTMTPYIQEHSMWDITSTLENDIFLPIGATLLPLFFLFRFCSESIDIRKDMNLLMLVKIFIRLFIVQTVLLSSQKIANAFFTMSSKAVLWIEKLCGSPTIGLPTELPVTLEQMGEMNVLFSLVFLVILIVVALAAFVLAYVLYFSCWLRHFWISLLKCFAGPALATLGGGQELARTGISYVRHMLGLIFQNILIYTGMMMCSVSSAYLIGTITPDTSDSFGIFMTLLLYVIDIVMYMGLSVFIVSSTARKMKEAFAL